MGPQIHEFKWLLCNKPQNSKRPVRKLPPYGGPVKATPYGRGLFPLGSVFIVFTADTLR